MTDKNAYNEKILIEKLQQLESLNRTIAHNLRGGVSNIKLLTELLMERKTSKNQLKHSKLSMSTSEGLQYIHDCSLALLKSLNAFMETFEMYVNGIQVWESCDIAKMINDIKAQLTGSIKDDVIYTFLGETHITYPKAYMESILYNLISNAVKYAKRDIAPEIAIITYNEQGRPVLRVKDNGIGIDLNAVGNRMFKLYQTFHEGYDSTGIGLYMIKLQIESLGGSISVKSAINEGTEFTVIF